MNFEIRFAHLISRTPLIGSGIEVDLGVIGAHNLGHSLVDLIDAVGKRALEEIAVRWYENTSVGAYADMCGMSEVNFRRLFREYTGTSPIDYRNSTRLTYARARLQSGEYNVSEVAELCGFSNLSFFIRLYKKKYGYTPKQE